MQTDKEVNNRVKKSLQISKNIALKSSMKKEISFSENVERIKEANRKRNPIGETFRKKVSFNLSKKLPVFSSITDELIFKSSTKIDNNPSDSESTTCPYTSDDECSLYDYERQRSDSEADIQTDSEVNKVLLSSKVVTEKCRRNKLPSFEHSHFAPKYGPYCFFNKHKTNKRDEPLIVENPHIDIPNNLSEQLNIAQQQMFEEAQPLWALRVFERAHLCTSD